MQPAVLSAALGHFLEDGKGAIKAGPVSLSAKKVAALREALAGSSFRALVNG
jgi:hypothetical protein